MQINQRKHPTHARRKSKQNCSAVESLNTWHFKVQFEVQI